MKQSFGSLFNRNQYFTPVVRFHLKNEILISEISILLVCVNEKLKIKLNVAGLVHAEHNLVKINSIKIYLVM